MLVAVVCLVVRVPTLAWLLGVVVSWAEVSLQCLVHHVGVDVVVMMLSWLLWVLLLVRAEALLVLVRRGRRLKPFGVVIARLWRRQGIHDCWILQVE